VCGSFEAVVFDFYNTLVEIDSYELTTAQALAKLGYHCPDIVAHMWSSDAFDGQTHPAGDGYDAWLINRFIQLCRDSGVAEEEAPNIAKILYDMDTSCTVRPLAHAEETMRLARNLGLRVGLCSNWDYDIMPYLASVGLNDFDAVITSRDVGARKPHRAPFEAVAGALSIPARSVVFVGDSLNADITGAMHAGMGAMWISGSSRVLLPGRLWQVRDLKEVGRRLHSLQYRPGR